MSIRTKDVFYNTILTAKRRDCNNLISTNEMIYVLELFRVGRFEELKDEGSGRNIFRKIRNFAYRILRNYANTLRNIRAFVRGEHYAERRGRIY